MAYCEPYAPEIPWYMAHTLSCAFPSILSTPSIPSRPCSQYRHCTKCSASQQPTTPCAPENSQHIARSMPCAPSSVLLRTHPYQSVLLCLPSIAPSGAEEGPHLVLRAMRSATPRQAMRSAPVSPLQNCPEKIFFKKNQKMSKIFKKTLAFFCFSCYDYQQSAETIGKKLMGSIKKML